MIDQYTVLYDEKGNIQGALLGPEAWAAVRDVVTRTFGGAKERPERREPVADWELLKQYWDFPYPVDMDVSCQFCGASTENWEQDDPRKFRLSSANLAGLVSFTCCGCNAKIIKRHFKNEIVVECQPYVEAKDQRKEALY